VGKAWYDTIPELIGEIEALERASRNKEQRQFLTDVIELVSKAKHALVHKKDKLEGERVAKRRRLLEITNNSSHSSSNSSITLTLARDLWKERTMKVSLVVISVYHVIDRQSAHSLCLGKTSVL
jgi:hypothetical protein